MGQVFINEISYKDINPSDRGVELAGPAGTDLNGWSMEFRDDNNTTYHTETITTSTPIDNENTSGKGGIWIPVSGLQDDNNNAIILYDNNNTPQDTVTYGSMPAISGTNIGVVQDATALVTPQNADVNNNNSLWWILVPASKGDLNVSQLPVELIAFDAEVIKNTTVRLEWITVSEEYNKHFEVQQSTNGKTFKTIGIVQGHGTTYDKQTYNFETKLTNNGLYYYRLKQVDFDDKFEYLNIISVKISANPSINNQVEIAPNPIRQNNKLTVRLSDYDEVDLIIYSMTGEVVQTYTNINENSQLIIDLPNGLYIYQLRQQSELIKTAKLIVIE